MNGMDAWITGSGGYDHPDNFGECVECGKRVELNRENENDTEVLCSRCGRAQKEEE